jgi:hypothetical protein
MTNIIRPDFQNNSQADTIKKNEAVPGYQLLLEIGFSSPPISRRVQVCGNMPLAGLHEVIKTCFGWNDEHGHRFFIGKIFYGPKSEDGTTTFDEAETRIHELQDGMQFIFTYLYDAGSGWECEITVEKTLPAKEEVEPPVFLDGEQASPPQQFIDIHDYQAFLSDFEVAEEGKRRRMLADYNLASNFNPVYCDMQNLATKVQQSIHG